PRALPTTVPLVTEAFARRGYLTAAFVSAEPVAHQWGLDRGFSLYNDDLEAAPSPLTPRERRGEDTAEAAARWLAAALKSKRPFFLWVHLFDPHHPYRAPAPYAERFPKSPYAAEVAYADACVGRLLETLAAAGRRAATAILVAGDHGEGLGEHGEATHAHLVHGSTIRVPVLCCWPAGWRARQEITEPVGLVDIAPTLYHLLDEKPPRLSGTSLLNVLRGESSRPSSRPLYVESLYDFLHFGWAPLYAVRLGSSYLIEADERAWLYDLAADPGETRNLAEDRPDEPRALRIALARLRAALEEIPAPPGGVLAAPPGYLQAPHASATLLKDADRTGKRRIPMEAIGDVVAFERVKNRTYQSGLDPLDESLERLGVLSGRDPENPSYLYWTGRVHRARASRLRAAGHPPEAVLKALENAKAFFLKTLNRRPDHASAQNLLFHCLIELDDPEPVLKGAAAVLEQGYENRDTRFWLAEAHLRRNAPGDLDQADRHNRAGRERFPDHDRLGKQRAEIERRRLAEKLGGTRND
ncbi:MAG: sulfatase-like hydrolase/transferase, partial [Planctomycetes bacterium]|nr:sulfatase-like hydrolase/transferase [Planctomycetota bacterium]